MIQKTNENNVSIKFQLDTCASCSTLTLQDYKTITNQPLKKSSRRIKLYDNSTIKPIGTIILRCKAETQLVKRVKFEVLEQASVSLLSAKASQALKLIKFNEECVLHTCVQNEKKLN